MKKKLICALLALVLLLSIAPAMSLTAKAQSNLKTSDELIQLLIAFEGFASRCIVDGTQRSVGYGTRCDVCDRNAPDYLDKNRECTAYNSKTPITREKAMELKRKYLTSFENQINSFATREGITFTQQQFDALMSLTYNCGGGWTVGYGISGTREDDNPLALHNALKSGDPAKIAYAIGTWKTFRNRIPSSGHIVRRALELQVYFHGIYDTSRKQPKTDRYVHLYGNGGAVAHAIHMFDTDHPSDIYASFLTTPEGYEFVGWFTEREGGTQVKKLTNALANGTALYAQWKNDKGEYYVGGDDYQEDNITGTWYKVTASALNVRSGPAVTYPIISGLTEGTRVKVTETKDTGDGKIWGKLNSGNWICIKNGNEYNAKPEDSGSVVETRYTVQFKDYDGTVISSTNYTKGAKVKVPADPVRDMDNNGIYEFVGWDKTVTNCEGNAVYTAQYKLKYSIGDVNRDGKEDDEDAIYLLRYAVFPMKYPISYKPDFDFDGDVDGDDAVYLLRHVVFPDKYPLKIF